MQPPNRAEFMPPQALEVWAPGTDEPAELGHWFEA